MPRSSAPNAHENRGDARYAEIVDRRDRRTGLAGTITGGAIAFASNNDSRGNVTGRKADRAVQAALAATGGGTANAVERDHESGATWEVEVSRPDGRIVDVRLDEGFSLIAVESDSETADTGDASA